MGTNTLNKKTLPATVEIDDVNQYFTALSGDFISRNVTTGATEDNVNKLGRAAFRWKEAHITNLFLNGALFDPSSIGGETKFAINSGATRTDSGQPDFLRADGTGASATILATTTNLQITANNASVSVAADIAITSLTVAPSSNNTALVDDTGMTGGAETKFTGEAVDDPIVIDTVGTEISNRVGEFICLKTPTGEFMFAFVEDATTLSRCYRGFFFDDSGVPVVRGVLSNNDTLTIMSLGWVFLDNDGVTVDVSYKSPVYSGVEPSGAAVDDYWFDLLNRLWKRHNGTSFVQVDRMLIGLLVIDTADCVAARSFDFTQVYDDFIDLRPEIKSVTEVVTEKGYSRLSVYGQTQELYAGNFTWNIASDLESPLTEAASTTYFLYVTEEGVPILATERPYDRRSELRGYYHPYHSWRYIGEVNNDSGSDFDKVSQLFIRSRIIASVLIENTPTTIDVNNIFRNDKNYTIRINNLRPTTDSVDLLLKTSNDKGVSFLGGSSDYSRSSLSTIRGNAVNETGGDVANINLTNTINIGNVNTATNIESLSGTINFNNPRQASEQAKIDWEISFATASGGNLAWASGSATIEDLPNGEAPDSFQLSLDSGTFAAGRITIIEEDIY